MSLYIVADESVYAQSVWKLLTPNYRDQDGTDMIYDPNLFPCQFGQTWFLIEAQSPEWACAVCDAVCERYFVHPNDKKFRNITEWVEEYQKELEEYQFDVNNIPLGVFAEDIIKKKGKSTFGVFEQSKAVPSTAMELITKNWNNRKAYYGQNYREYYE